MADSYLTISLIAHDDAMRRRMNAAAAQQDHLGNVQFDPDAISWVTRNAYVWASSPGWAEAWDSALVSHSDDPEYQPGVDQAVITDGMILATVQSLGAT